MLKRKGQKGFTLIELLIVIAIIGIIAAVAVPMYQKKIRSANETATVLELRNLGQAEAGARASGRYMNLSELVANKEMPTSWHNGLIKSNYKFSEVGTFDSSTFEFSAEPTSKAAGDRAFNIIEDNTVRWMPGLTAPTRESGKELSDGSSAAAPTDAK